MVAIPAIPAIPTPPGFLTTPLALFLMFAGFALGIGLVPIMATIKLSPPYLGKGLARLAWELAGIGMGHPLLSWQSSKDYTVESANGDEPDQSGWRRCGMNPMAVGMEESRDVFEPHTVDRSELDAGGESDGGTTATGAERGAVKALFDRSIPGEWLVDAGAWLFDFKDAADGSGVIKARSEEFEDTGGDSSGHSAKTHAVMMLGMASLGGVFGYAVFLL